MGVRSLTCQSSGPEGQFEGKAEDPCGPFGLFLSGGAGFRPFFSQQSHLALI